MIGNENMLQVACPQCGRKFEFNSNRAAPQQRCYACGCVFNVLPVSPRYSAPNYANMPQAAPRFQQMPQPQVWIQYPAAGTKAPKRKKGVGLVGYGILALIIILACSLIAKWGAEQQRLEAEQRRLAAEANQKVAGTVREAEAAWEKGDLVLANQKLAEAAHIPHATNIAPVRQLCTRMANAEVESLMAEAIAAVKAGNIESAKEKVAAALAVPHASALADARKLNAAIGQVTDPNCLKTALMEVPDEAFDKLKKSGEMPSELVSGYEELDTRIAALAKTQIADVAAPREQRRQEELAQARAKAEAARKAEEERKARELAAAEAKAKADSAGKDNAIDDSHADAYKTRICELLEQLLNFKDDYKFRYFGFGRGGPYYKWLAEIQALSHEKKSVPFDLRVAAGNIRQLGMDYKNHSETEYTRLMLPEIKAAIDYDEYLKTKNR